MINLSIPKAVSFSLGFLVSLRVFNLLILYVGIASFINSSVELSSLDHGTLELVVWWLVVVEECDSYSLRVNFQIEYSYI